jgi:hypothetical protein
VFASTQKLVVVGKRGHHNVRREVRVGLMLGAAAGLGRLVRGVLAKRRCLGNELISV